MGADVIHVAKGVLLSSGKVNERSGRKFKLQPLPFGENALEPYMSEKTIQYHYGKHLATYIDKTNDLISGSEYENMSIEEIMLKSSGGLFNNSAQVYNHYFQFEALKPHRGGDNLPKGKILEAIEKEYGSFEEFKNKFKEKSTGLFGSGYTWLVTDENGKLDIIQTKDAENPLKENKKPLLNLDVWEHAYYLDVQNQRPKYVDNFWHIVDWEAVEKRMEA